VAHSEITVPGRLRDDGTAGEDAWANDKVFVDRLLQRSRWTSGW
jgi:hypothetical protein